MRQPWQVWTVFGIALMIVIPPMIWLSVKAVEVDRQREIDRRETELARQQAELQERLSSALYRLDLKLLPLVAQEAARPHYLYEAFYAPESVHLSELTRGQNMMQQAEIPSDPQPTADPLGGKLPSPLMFDQPEFVVMHFQIDDQGNIDSPQQPTGDARSLAISCCGFQPKDSQGSERLQKAKETFDYNEIYLSCATLDPSSNTAPTQSLADTDNPTGWSTAPPRSLLRGTDSIDRKEIDPQADSDPGYRVAGTKGNKFDQQVEINFKRGNREYNQRVETTNQIATQQWANSVTPPFAIGDDALRNLEQSSDGMNIQWGPMRPMWVGENLILARRVRSRDQPKVQVCWLNWNSIELALREEVKDLLPSVSFEPIDAEKELNIGTALTTLPVRLVVNDPNLIATLGIDRMKKLPSGFSGLTISLLVSWLGLGLATLAATVLLHGVLKMSERRASFVSAVTHELRTPLTTFRMYAEMLAEKMVPPEKTQEYANTLRVQADRLSHLVENVLQFARLERGNAANPAESLSVVALLERFQDRLIERVEQEGMKLELVLPEAVAETTVHTQPSQIEQILFNLVDNACKYAKPFSDPRVIVKVELVDNKLIFQVQDHGPGVEKKYRARMFQPFCKSDQDAANSAPGVGLGLALCQRMAKTLKGRLYLAAEKSSDATGACFVLEIPQVQR